MTGDPRLSWKESWMHIFQSIRHRNKTDNNTTDNGFYVLGKTGLERQLAFVYLFDTHNNAFITFDEFIACIQDREENFNSDNLERTSVTTTTAYNGRFFFVFDPYEMILELQDHGLIDPFEQNVHVAELVRNVHRHKLIAHWKQYVQTHYASCILRKDNVSYIPWLEDIAKWTPTFLSIFNDIQGDWWNILDQCPLLVYFWTITQFPWVHYCDTFQTCRPDLSDIPPHKSWDPICLPNFNQHPWQTNMMTYYEQETFPQHMRASVLARMHDIPEFRPYQFILPTQSCRTFKQLRSYCLHTRQQCDTDSSSSCSSPQPLVHIHMRGYPGLMGGQDFLLAIMNVMTPRSPVPAIWVQSAYTPFTALEVDVFGFFIPSMNNRLVLYHPQRLNHQ